MNNYKYICFIYLLTLLISTVVLTPQASYSASFIIKTAQETELNHKKVEKTAEGSGQRRTFKKLSHRARLIKIEANDPVDAVQKAALELNIPLNQILYIEPDFKRSLLGVPNDSDYSRQTGLKALGFESTWDQLAERTEVIVGVIDTGVDVTHPDLKNRIWKNSGEDWQNGTGQNNSLDDDGDGFVDNYFGVNVIAGKGNASDDNGHGTSVAGIIAAECNNTVGICGVSQKATIFPIKALDSFGDGSTSDFIAAVDYLIDFKKRTGKPVVINASLGGYDYSQAEHDELKLAGEEGILIVAPAGNNHLDNDITPLYPASYDLPNIISVASVNDSGQLSYFSEWGLTSVDLAAPGEQVYSSRNGGGYRTISGTSFSAPFVAGVVAMLQSVNPAIGIKAKDYIVGGVSKQVALADVLVSGGTLSITGSIAQSALDQIEWSMNLNKGMNLVSFPLSPLYCGDSAILAGKENIKSIWRFGDAIWNSYIPAQPGFSDLHCFGAGEGYWVDAKDAGNLTVAGFTAGEWPVLKPGWNLVGFPVADSMAVADLLAQRYSGVPVDSLWGYVNGEWRSYIVGNVGMSDLDVVESGKGYWVHVVAGI